MNTIKISDSAENISAIEFQAFEDEYKLTLPDEYKQFILSKNGGYPDLTLFVNENDDEFVINSFSCINFEDADVVSVNDSILTHQIEEDNIPKYLFPFGLDAGGNDFCISLKKEDYGKIYKFYQDGRSPEMVYVAQSFQVFINGLKLDEE
ncbi:SMI1/KNR4 family protein [Aquimarina sp. 2201CG14-23]|uniref:SMI1/KNR4 family protein n=1 Tax=Aquimarina mycalae TaxID=3040073 RepID=UPI0024782730|nr:SMI1/KNR4 family protein [Aquimarina sp. 2201CG14-23]MDH7447688.1 SMI1/KNR4 family protein [Aquimarina sp. 2201CG14-23]